MLPLFLTLLLLSKDVLSTHPDNGGAITLRRRSPSSRTPEEWGAWAKGHREGLTAKYGGRQPQKRSSGSNLLVNQNLDSSFYGTLAIGTPPVSYNVILDTGSADLWLASSECTANCDNIATFNPTSSSSYRSLSTSFSITYGSGDASGHLATDTVQMAGFQVSEQVFAVCDDLSDGLLTPPVSGLLGLGFQRISSARATPFWETLVQRKAWDEPVMGFHLTRFINDTNADESEPGGSFTMGYTNSSLYTGDIQFSDIPDGQETYWIQQITGLSVQGNSISLPSGDSSLAAIDTGTTLVGGPSDAIASIYQQIEGSAPGAGDFQGYWTYPCSTSVQVSMSFGGGRSWPISPADFRLTRMNQDTCVGAFFELDIGGRNSGPSWIVGDTFLKNVYSVFRYSPASVGFAQLSSTALAMNGVNGPVPSATIGSVVASATGTRGGGSNSNTSPSLYPIRTGLIWWLVTFAVVALIL